MLSRRGPAPYRCARCFITSFRSYATPASPQIAAVAGNDAPIDAAISTPNVENSTPRTQRSSAFALRTYKPRTPGVRHLKRPINDHLWKGKPFAKLTFAKKGQAKGGRNGSGRVTVRHRGGGHKRRIRVVDYERTEAGVHTVDRIEHDPNRSAHLALITHSRTQKKSYIVAAEGMRAGDTVQSFRKGVPRSLLQEMGGVLDPGMLAAKTATRGNCLPLHMVPLGSQVYNVGSRPEKGAVFCRSAGTYAIVVSREGGPDDVTAVVVRLQSGETRRVHPNACATIGVASNPHHHFRQLGKAGRSRWLNIRPTVRGVAMNASDHPHGGGRGKSKGNRIPVSIWGRTPAKSGFKTRPVRKPNTFVVHERPRNQGKRRNKV